jgi:hypothetical protein
MPYTNYASLFNPIVFAPIDISILGFADYLGEFSLLPRLYICLTFYFYCILFIGTGPELYYLVPIIRPLFSIE